MLLERDANSVLTDLREIDRATPHFPIPIIPPILKGVKKRYRALQRGNLPCGNGVETVIAESTTPNTIPSVRPFFRVVLHFRQGNRDQTAYAPPQLQLTSFVNLPGHKDTTMRDPPESVYTILAWCQTVVWGAFFSLHMIVSKQWTIISFVTTLILVCSPLRFLTEFPIEARQ